MGHHRRDDDHQSRPKESDNDSSSPAMVVVTEEDGADEPATVASADHVWAAAEGYTPLQDITTGEQAVLYSDGSSTMMMMVGESSSTTSALFAHALEQDDDDESEHKDEVDGATDFRSVADNALMGLENDYRNTVLQTQGFTTTPIWPSGDEGQGIFWAEDEAAGAHGPLSADDFVADFDEAAAASTKETNTKASVQTEEELAAEIDADAVRRAVENIALSNPALTAKCKNWEMQQKETAVTAPRLHPIIPRQPLAAFRKSTNKAVTATDNLSRSACIAEALRKLDILKTTRRTIRIHIVGCDHVECATEQRVRALFGPVVRWIGAYAEAPQHLLIDLIGPNMPTQQQWSPITDLTSGAASTRLTSATLTCHKSIYDETVTTEHPPPDLAIAFNAGVWGYNEWKTTIRCLINHHHRIDSSSLSIPFVFTAYTLQEAEDDFEVIQEVVNEHAGGSDTTTSSVRCIWEPEANPFASKRDRETANAAPGRRYRENAAWQAWRL